MSRFKERGHIPSRPTGDSEAVCAPPTSFLAPRRSARSPRRRTPSSSACNGTTPAATARLRLDTLGSARGGSVWTATLHPRHQLLVEFPVFGAIGFPARPHEQIGAQARAVESRQHLPPQDLAQPSLHAIAIHDPRAVTRHDDANPRTCFGGRGVVDVQVARPAPLPPLNDPAYLRPAGDPSRSRQALVRRTLTACLHGAATFRRPAPRAACDPSCDAG